jgi:hypothetical protein
MGLAVFGCALFNLGGTVVVLFQSCSNEFAVYCWSRLNSHHISCCTLH